MTCTHVLFVIITLNHELSIYCIVTYCIIIYIILHKLGKVHCISPFSGNINVIDLVIISNRRTRIHEC